MGSVRPITANFLPIYNLFLNKESSSWNTAMADIDRKTHFEVEICLVIANYDMLYNGQVSTASTQFDLALLFETISATKRKKR